MSSKGGKNQRCSNIAVDVFDLDGNYLASYDSINMASKILHLNKVWVWKCVCEEKRRCGQFQIRKKGLLDSNLESDPHIAPHIGYTKKSVNVYDLNGKYITSYKSINMAAKELKIRCSGIYRVLKNGYGRCGQYQFRYKEISVSSEEGSMQNTSIKPYKGDSNVTSYEKPILIRVYYMESDVKTGILYKLVPYTGENRCVKCSFAQDESNCIKYKCTTPDGQNGYFRFFCEASRKDYFVAQV